MNEILDLYNQLQNLSSSNKRGKAESLNISFSYLEGASNFSNKLSDWRIKNLDNDEKELVEQVLRELELYMLVKQLQDMKIYYQIVSDPRNNENKSLYAKAYLPKYGNSSKRKLIGVHYGTLSNHPNGWRETDKEKARKELIDKGLKMLTSG